MSKPAVSDSRLTRLMNDLYREDAKIGSGSTADAVRYETLTGNSVGGVFHTPKAENYSTAWQNGWMQIQMHHLVIVLQHKTCCEIFKMH